MPETDLESIKQGRYLLTRKIGEGSQAQTFEGVDKLEGSAVAIKRFTVRGAESWKDIELAEREALVLAQVEHVNLPRYRDHFEEAGCLYLVMELIEGDSVATLTQTRGGIDQRGVMRMLKDVGDALFYLHRLSPPIIHRDVKPSNLIRRRDGSFCLIDFGAVRQSLKLEGGSTIAGTFGYMAPEQFQGRGLPESDIYGLGMTALHLLTGQDPDKLPHRGLEVDVDASLAGSAEEPLATALKRMTAINPDLRVACVTDAFKTKSGRRKRSDKSPFSASAKAASSGLGGSSEHAYRPTTTALQADHALKVLLASPMLLSLLLTLLWIARVATSLLFELFLSLLFSILGIFLGQPMQRVGRRMSEIGRKGNRRLQAVSQAMRDNADDIASGRRNRRNQRQQTHRKRRRVRVDAHDASAEKRQHRRAEQTPSQDAVEQEQWQAQQDAEGRRTK